MAAKIEVKELLQRLIVFSKSEGDADSPENPVDTRQARALDLRQRLVKALSFRSSPK